MTAHVGLVRAVMQGREGLTRAVLLAAVADAGGTNGATFHATGNLLFDAEDGAVVCARVATALTQLLGRETPVLHRTTARLAAIVAAAPFAGTNPDAERLVVFADADTAPAVAAVDGFVVALDGDLAVVREPGAAHPMPIVERLVDGPVTTRSIGTIAGIVRTASGA